MANRIIVYDEEGKEVNEGNPFYFGNTVVESYTEKTYTIFNDTPVDVKPIPFNNDPTIFYEDYPKYMKPREKAKFTLRYKPTMEHLKPTESLIGFDFQVV